MTTASLIHSFPARRRTSRGMTLVEVLAVVVILGLVAGVAIVSFSGSFKTAKHELAKSMIERVVGKLETYHIEKGTYPPSDLGLSVLTSADPGTAWYLSGDMATDPWGRPFQYLAPGSDGHPFEVITFGEDGARGGDGANADLSSTRLRGSAS